MPVLGRHWLVAAAMLGCTAVAGCGSSGGGTSGTAGGAGAGASAGGSGGVAIGGSSGSGAALGGEAGESFPGGSTAAGGSGGSSGSSGTAGSTSVDPTTLPRNLALHRAAYHSSAANYDNTAHLATDGISSVTSPPPGPTVWTSAASDPQWIYVDLGAPAIIDNVKLYWDSAYASAYALEASDELSSWQSVYETSSGDGGLDDIDLPDVEGRYVRMYGTARGTSGGYSLVEIEVHGTGGVVPTPKRQPPPLADGTQYLSGGNWKLQRAAGGPDQGASVSSAGFDDSDWVIATVPGTVLASYLELGAVPDPDFGDQQLQISEAFFQGDFWYRNTFDIPESFCGRRIWLGFDGINWKADVFLNGSSVGHIEGAFIRGRFDITSVADCGATNTLAVYIHQNDNPGSVTLQTRETADPNGGVLGADNPTIHASIGWDWMPTIRGRNIGIHDDVYLSATDDVSIVDPFVRTTLPLPSTSLADLAIQVGLQNHSPTPVNGVLSGTITPGNIELSQDVTLPASETTSVTLDSSSFAELSIANPELWWPNGYGDPTLYELSLEFATGGVVSDRRSVSFGIRQITTDTTDEVLKLFVNGKRIFARGGNWGMSDSMLRLDAEGYDIRVRLHREQNFTMIRNWVGMTGSKHFYEACDRHGILIWDDFWLANPGDGPNPNDPEMFMRNARDKIARVRNHPSVALYCGRNEGDPPPELADALSEAVATLDGTRPYIPHSAAGVVAGFGPYSLQSPAWYFQNGAGIRLHSEIGMPNVPPVESMRAMMPEESLWPIGEMWGIHDFCDSAQGASSYLDAINNRYGQATGIEDFCTKAQMVNMESAKALFEARAGAHGNGALLWMSQSAWPSTVWQTYDYYLEPTAAYFANQEACEPLHVLWDPTNDAVKVTNNTGHDYANLTAIAQIYNLDGTQQYSTSVAVSPAEDTVTDCFTIEYPAGLSPVHFIRLQLLGGADVLSDNFYWRNATSADFTALASLPRVSLSGAATRTVSGTANLVTASITNDTSDLALMIRLRLLRAASLERVLPTYYQENYFSLPPGESKQVEIEFESKYLAGEEPILAVEGWNINPGQIEIL